MSFVILSNSRSPTVLTQVSTTLPTSNQLHPAPAAIVTMLVSLRLVGLLAVALVTTGQARASPASVSARDDVSADDMATKVGEVENGFIVVAEEETKDGKLVWFAGKTSYISGGGG